MTRIFIYARESVVRVTRGQTMTEYTLVLVAVAGAVIGTYLAFGNYLSSLANGFDSTVANA